jgi:hypothetical protein
LTTATRSIVVFRVTDRITGSGGQVRSLVFGVESTTEAPDATVLCDWVLLRRLNELARTRAPRSQDPPRSIPPAEAVREAVRRTATILSSQLPDMDLPFRFPTLDLLAVLWPEPGIDPS